MCIYWSLWAKKEHEGELQTGKETGTIRKNSITKLRKINKANNKQTCVSVCVCLVGEGMEEKLQKKEREEKKIGENYYLINKEERHKRKENKTYVR